LRGFFQHSEMLPPGHTAYSWGEGGDQPLGHTKFSWMAGCAVCGGDSKTMGGEGEEKKPTNSNSNAAAVKKGFLEPRAEPVNNLSDFLRRHVPDVLRRADELHRTAEEDEGNPFKNKYAARELLKGALLQFVACHEEASATGLEGEWEEAIARVEHLMGINLVETEEISGGEKTIVACIGEHRKKSLLAHTKFPRHPSYSKHSTALIPTPTSRSFSRSTCVLRWSASRQCLEPRNVADPN
jgi:hypothetical protein